MTILDLYHLPSDLDDSAGEPLILPCGDEVAFRYPRLSPVRLHRIMDALREARERVLARLPHARIIALVDRAITRWLDPFSPYRRQAEELIPLVTGYSEPAVRKGLTSFLASFRAEHLQRLLASEFSDPGVLDGFRPRGEGGGLTRAYGPSLTTHVFSGNVPGLAAQSLVCALLVKSASLGKVASGEPVFPALFVRSLVEVEPRLADCLAVTYWPSGSAELEEVAFTRADAVIAYGSDEAVRSVALRVPRTIRFVPYRHRLSFGLVARDALSREVAQETAERAAYDVAKYDQQGCLSPHVLYVEEGGDVDPPAFARLLAHALEAYARRVPRGRIGPAEATSIRRTLLPYELDDRGATVYRSERGMEWAVIYDPDPAFVPSCLNRVIRVKPVAQLEQAVDAVRPFREYLQTVGVAGPGDRLLSLAERLGALGADRICPLGQMGDPSPLWHHDGRFALLELVRWTDVEDANRAGRWEFAHPDRGLYGVAQRPHKED